MATPAYSGRRVLQIACVVNYSSSLLSLCVHVYVLQENFFIRGMDPLHLIGCVWFSDQLLAWTALACSHQANPWLFGCTMLVWLALECVWLPGLFRYSHLFSKSVSLPPLRNLVEHLVGSEHPTNRASNE
jgi:hypothetical protein